MVGSARLCHDGHGTENRTHCQEKSSENGMAAKPIPWTADFEARLCGAFGVEKKRLGAALVAFFGVYRSRLTDWKIRGMPEGRVHALANRRKVPFEWLAFGESGPAKVAEELARAAREDMPEDGELAQVLRSVQSIRQAGLEREWRAIRDIVELACRGLPPEPPAATQRTTREERRKRASRYKLRLPATLAPGGLAVIRDIGLAGACAEHRTELRPGQDLQVLVDLPRGRVRAQAVVIWTNRATVGSARAKGVAGFRSGILFRDASR